MQRFASWHLLLPLALILVLAGCADGEYEETPPANTPTTRTAAEMPDTTGAAVWAHLTAEGYQSNWTLWPDKGTYYTGQQPHGMLLTTYLNPIALEALNGNATTMPPGAIIVKENYMPDSTLAAITVMFKAAGFDPGQGDWFYSKHLGTGVLDKAPNGMSLEGRVPGCQNCHGARKDNDYLFTGDLN